MTSLAEERAEQARWKLRPRFSGVEVFDLLVDNEFASPEQVAAEEARELRAVVEFAVATVPYYRALFARLGLAARDIRDRRDLVRLPLLGKQQLRGDGFEALKPEALPPGVEIAGMVRSSGSTGPPTQVVFSVESNLMFTYLNQRQTRWFRRDPSATVAMVRSPTDLPRLRPGEVLAVGETVRVPGWRYMGEFFETGPAVGFSIFNPVEDQLAWLRRERPDYLIMRGHSLEHLAMGAGGERPCESLKAMTAISDAITPATRRYLETVHRAPVQQGYGLNEIGLVAVRCESGRYHVHREHCIVEIVDDSGVPCAAGESGRLVVTGLRNLAMPLVRYDSDDLVTALEGPCPCGRTLPAFGEIHGRYSRIKPLPRGTLDLVAAVRTALQAMPADLARSLRRYQLHQFRDGRFELRLVAAAPLPPAFGERMMGAWAHATGSANLELAFRDVAEIPLYTMGDKFDDFVSEYAAGEGAGTDRQ